MGTLHGQTGVPYGRRLLPVLVDELDPERLFARVPRSTHLQDGFIDVTCQSFARAINRAASWLVDTFGKSLCFQTLAYFGPSDIRYCIFLLGASKVGYKILLPSPRNSLEGQLALLSATDCKAILTPKGYNLQRGLVDKSTIPLFHVAELLELLAEGDVRQYKFSKSFDEAKDDPLMVLHTSGSTGLPKPVVLSHGWLASMDSQNTLRPLNGYASAYSALTAKRTFCSIPPFHVFGLAIALFIPLLSDPETHVIWPPTGRPVSTALIDEVLDSATVDILVTTPSMLEDLVQSPESVSKLERLHSIVTGGGPLSREAGDILCQKTNIINIFGATETSMLPIFLPASDDWQYFHYNPALRGIEFRPVGNGTYEQVLVRHPSTDPYHATWCTFPHLQEYSINDLYTKHPTKENLWLYAGRADDIIVLSNGEKFNPTAMESILVSHPDVRGALVVGQGRFTPAAILEFKDELARKLVTAEERARIIDEIWPYIMQANKSAPGHAQLARDSIIFNKAGKPFLRAAKGTIQRKATVKLYEAEIEERYQDDNKERSENVPHIDITGDITALETALAGLVANILGVESLSSDQDFFAAGMDSLQVLKVATQLEAALGSGYQAEITTRLIYSNTTLAALAATLKDTSGARESAPGGAILQQTLEKYTRQLPAKSAIGSKKLDVGLAVVLTGSTGSLGSYLLDILASSQIITRIYCLNRRTDAKQQQAKINATRGLVSEWGDRVTFLHADLSKPNLGLAVYDYDCLRKEACVIIHNQWEVNFNLTLSSFEPHIVGTLNLIKLSSESHNSPPIFFTSSIGTLGNWTSMNPGKYVPEVALEDPSIPLPQGYSESKWITERLLDLAREKSGVSSAILRVGQIAGPVNVAKEKHGMWNKKEWLPTIIQSSQYLKALPRSLGSEDTVTWVPVDILAAILVELVSNDCLFDQNDNKGAWSRYYHLTNPHKMKWSTLLPIIQDYFGGGPLRLVDLDEWVEMLEASGTRQDADAARNPGLILLNMFQHMRREQESVLLETKHTRERSMVMQSLKPVNQEWMRLWLEQWAF